MYSTNPDKRATELVLNLVPVCMLSKTAISRPGRVQDAMMCARALPTDIWSVVNVASGFVLSMKESMKTYGTDAYTLHKKVKMAPIS